MAGFEPKDPLSAICATTAAKVLFLHSFVALNASSPKVTVSNATVCPNLTKFCHLAKFRKF